MERRFKLTEVESRALEQAQDRTKDGPTRIRFLAVRLYGTGYPMEEVVKIAGYTRSSVMHWSKSYRANGIDGLRDKRVGGNRAKLKRHQLKELRERLRSYTPAEMFGKEASSPDGRFWTSHDLARGLREWYGVTHRSHVSYVKTLTRCGLSYQRPAKVYKSRSEAKVVEFESQLEKN